MKNMFEKIKNWFKELDNHNQKYQNLLNPNQKKELVEKNENNIVIKKHNDFLFKKELFMEEQNPQKKQVIKRTRKI